MKLYYEKDMMRFDVETNTLFQISNTRIVELLEKLRDELYSEYQCMCFHFKVKPHKIYSREGKIIIKTNLDKQTLLIKLGKVFGNTLSLKW